MSGKRFSMGITQLPPQPRRASLLCNESVLPDSHFSSRTENPPAPPPRPAQVTRFSSGIAAVAASSFESQGGRHQQQLASKITLREELEQVHSMATLEHPTIFPPRNGFLCWRTNKTFSRGELTKLLEKLRQLKSFASSLWQLWSL